MCRRSFNCGARIVLALVNVLVLVFASLLLYFGVVGLDTFDAAVGQNETEHAMSTTKSLGGPGCMMRA